MGMINTQQAVIDQKARSLCLVREQIQFGGVIQMCLLLIYTPLLHGSSEMDMNTQIQIQI